MESDKDIFHYFFLKFNEQSISPMDLFKELFSTFRVVCGVQLQFFLQFIQFIEDRGLFWSLIRSFSGFLRCGKPEFDALLFCLPVLITTLRYVIMSGSSERIILRIVAPAGSLNLDCSRVITEKSAIFMFFPDRVR